jgi:UDP-N-acetylglucosamine 2-epimerase (non-hydrolysing)
MNSDRREILFVFGTRPEAIKLAPVIRALSAEDSLRVKVCVTGQHRQMLDQVLQFFGLRPDFDLNVMTANQSLPGLTAKVLDGVSDIVSRVKPAFVVVQGDTTTTFAGALSAFLNNVPVAHVEAGLRSFRLDAPFPEEANRVLTGRLSTLHFAPTASAAANLDREGINANVHVVGNTVVDALISGLDIIRSGGEGAYEQKFSAIDFGRESVLVTVHRRESYGEPLQRIISALRRLAEKEPEVQFVYPVHLNPNIRQPVMEALSGISNVMLIEPLAYDQFIWLMSKAILVITDSGGVQEEAPTLGLPVLVLRDVTERMEGVDGGAAALIGSDEERIVSAALGEISRMRSLQGDREIHNPYGDGRASGRIARTMREFLS